jgi:hypothetical protein
MQWKSHCPMTAVAKRNPLLITAIVAVLSLCAHAQFGLQGEITEGGSVQFDYFGFSVATNGNTIAATGYQSTAGSILVYTEPGNGWTNLNQPTAVLTTSDQSALNSVAINGSTIVGTSSSGSAYVFVMPLTGWADETQTAILTPSDGAVLTSIAISGNTVVGGSPTASGVASQTGAAYVFVMPVGGWVNANETGKLEVANGLTDDRMGFSVAIDGNTVVAGAPDKAQGKVCPTQGCHFFQGGAYVFVQPANGWTNMTQTCQLSNSAGLPGDNLGTAVSVSGNVVVVGASQEDSYLGSGEAYIFVRPANGWANSTAPNAKLYASNGYKYAYFGSAISISGNTVVVGAGDANDGNNLEQGEAYVYVEPGGGWKGSLKETADLVSADGNVGDQFGWSVSLNVTSGTTVIAVGAPYHQVGSSIGQGTTYVF